MAVPDSRVDVYLAHALRGKTAGWRYSVVIVSGIVAGLLLGAILIVAATLAGALPADTLAELTRPEHPVVFFGANGVIFGALVAGLALAARLIQSKRFGDIVGAWSWRLVALGAAIWLAVQILATASDYLIAPGSFTVTAGAGFAPLAVAALLGLGVQTFAEEFVFRGYLTQGLLLGTGRPWVAATLSGILFGALHLPNGWPQAANALLCGVAWAMIAMRSGGIALTWGLHLANNLFAGVVVVSAGDVFKGAPGLLSQSTNHLLWWDTTLSAVALGATLCWVLRLRAPWTSLGNPDKNPSRRNRLESEY